MTGRPRRCGWYDAVAVRYAVRVNGLDALALTKLDVLDGLPELQVCTSYRCRGAMLTEMPGDTGAARGVRAGLRNAARAGRRRPRACGATTTCRARRSAYVARLEEITGVPAAIISTGLGAAKRRSSAKACSARWRSLSREPSAARSAESSRSRP